MKWRGWIPVFGWLAVILTLTSLPKPPRLPGMPLQGDKIGHLVAYLVLGVLVYGAMRLQWPGMSLPAVARKTVSWGLIYGVLDELHQIPIPGRGCSGWDLLADAIGIVAGAVGAMYLARRASRKEEPPEGS